MDQKTLKELREESDKDDPMEPRTLRLPPAIDKEIRSFCKKKGIRFSVMYRACIIRGWEELKS